MPYDLAEGLLSAFAICDRITRYLIENLSDEVWQLKAADGKGRTVGSMAAHIHNVRLMWLKAAGSKVPDGWKLEAATREQTLKALQESHDALAQVLRPSLQSGQVKGFKPDAASFVGYLIAHEAHHRGQMSMLARMLGHGVSKQVQFGMWEWGTRGKEL